MDCEPQSHNSFAFPFQPIQQKEGGKGKIKIIDKKQRVQEQIFQDTIKFTCNNKENEAINEQNTRKTPFFPHPKVVFAIKSPQKQIEATENKRVQEIITKDPLRLRFAQLLPNSLFLPIGFNGQQLLKFLQLIDKTIQFLTTHRRLKNIFFQHLKKSIFENSSIIIEMKYIQQILFLDQSYYLVEWAINESIKRYDLKIGLPKSNRGIQWRKSNMRKKIVEYLNSKQQQFLSLNGAVKSSEQQWHPQFKYERLEIPLKQLHLKPRENCLTTLEGKAENKDTKKQLLKSFTKKKDLGDGKSITSSNVAAMIFSKKSASQISSIVIQAIKQKQKKLEQQKAHIFGSQQGCDKKELLKILEEIYRIFIFKKVSNIFKMTILDILRDKFHVKDQHLIIYLDKLLIKSDANCFKLVQSSSKAQVIQIDKQKYKKYRQFLQEQDKI